MQLLILSGTGIKPLSIYGLVHFFQHRGSLVNGGYVLSTEEQHRTLAILREHLLDVDDVEANRYARADGYEESQSDRE